jgi:hypothetical protein
MAKNPWFPAVKSATRRSISEATIPECRTVDVSLAEVREGRLDLTESSLR